MIHTTKETLGYWGRKSYISAARGAAKREEKHKGTEVTNQQTNYWSSSIRSRDEPMKKQNRENEE